MCRAQRANRRTESGRRPRSDKERRERREVISCEVVQDRAEKGKNRAETILKLQPHAYDRSKKLIGPSPVPHRQVELFCRLALPCAPRALNFSGRQPLRISTMSLDAKGAAALALHRFGLGPRAGSIRMIASDPRGALVEELEKPGAGQIADKDMLTAPQAARLAFHYNQEQEAKRISARISDEQRKTTMAVMTPDAQPDDTAMMTVPGAAEAQQPTPPQQNVNREVMARIRAATN